jgi:AcrR family transcriptional regulator
MQDVIREAGLSVGAVYPYFPSKNDLIAALAEQVVGQLGTTFDALAAEQPPPPIATVTHRAVPEVFKDGLSTLLPRPPA